MMDDAGGLAKICKWCETESSDSKYDVYRLVSAAIRAYSKESLRGESEVITTILNARVLATLASASKQSSTPSSALEYILSPFAVLGRAPLVQRQARDSGVIAALGDALLVESNAVREVAVKAIVRLQEDNLQNRHAMCDANIPFMLCTMIPSVSGSLRESAVAALHRPFPES